MTATETVRIAKEYQNSPHLRPRGDNLVVIPIYEERETYVGEGGVEFKVRISEGGVALPDIVENEPIEGRVVALGDGSRDYLSSDLAERLAIIGIGAPPGARVPWSLILELAKRFMEEANKPMPFQHKIGDRVLFIPWHATTIVLDEIEFNLISERDILGDIEEGSDALQTTAA